MTHNFIEIDENGDIWQVFDYESESLLAEFELISKGLFTFDEEYVVIPIFGDDEEEEQESSH